MSQHYLSDRRRQVGEERDLLQVLQHEVPFVRGSLILLADTRNRLELALVVVVHEIDKALLLSEPVRKVIVLLLTEVYRAGVGETRVTFEGELVAEGRLGGGSTGAFDLAVDDAEEVQSLLHL
jgi:hypothetical protein